MKPTNLLHTRSFPFFRGSAISLLLFAGQLLYAQSAPTETFSPSAPVREPTAILLLNGAFGAMASPQIQQSLKSVVLSGTISTSGSSTATVGTFTAMYFGSHFLLTTSVGGHRMRYSALGRHGRVDLDGKISSLTTSGASDIGGDIFPLLEPWASYADPHDGVTSAHDQSIDGVSCKEIDIQRPLGISLFAHSSDEVRVFIDTSSGLIRAVDYAMNQTRIYHPRHRMRILYENYQVMNGIRTPMTVIRMVNERVITVLHITGLDTKQTFDDSALVF